MGISDHAWIQQVRDAVEWGFALERDERAYLLSLLDKESLSDAQGKPRSSDVADTVKPETVASCAESPVPGASVLDKFHKREDDVQCRDTEKLPPIPDDVADQLAHEVDASGTPFLETTVDVQLPPDDEVRVWLVLEELYTSWVETTVKIPEGREVSVMLINGNDVHVYTREKETDDREHPTGYPSTYECREVRFGHATDETHQGAKE